MFIRRKEKFLYRSLKSADLYILDQPQAVL